MNTTNLRKLLIKLNRYYSILREQELKYGDKAPDELLDLISAYEHAIAMTEEAIEGKISSDELEEALAPLSKGVDGPTIRAESSRINKIVLLIIPLLIILCIGSRLVFWS